MGTNKELEPPPPIARYDMCMCKRCGHYWKARTDNPKQCPTCTSVNWHRPARPGNYKRSKPVKSSGKKEKK